MKQLSLTSIHNIDLASLYKLCFLNFESLWIMDFEVLSIDLQISLNSCLWMLKVDEEWTRSLSQLRGPTREYFFQSKMDLTFKVDPL